MIGFDDLDPPQPLADRPGRLPAGNHQSAGQPVAQLGLHRRRNRRAGLARAQYQDGPQAGQIEMVAVRGKRTAVHVHHAVNGSGRIRRPDACGHGLEGEPAEI